MFMWTIHIVRLTARQPESQEATETSKQTAEEAGEEAVEEAAKEADADKVTFKEAAKKTADKAARQPPRHFRTFQDVSRQDSYRKYFSRNVQEFHEMFNSVQDFLRSVTY